MPNDERVEQLLDQIFDNDSSPEEVCRACPELLPEVRQRWSRLQKIQAEIDALFPTPRDSSPTPPGPMRDNGTLPLIAGYEVEGLIGRGGMGVVFRARHLRLNRKVALKMILAGAYAGARELAQFQREAEAVAALRHPNIVQIHDIGDSDGRPYFTMEYVEDGTLAQKLAGQPQPARPAAGLLAALAQAVQVAHDNGIVHRDLKPSNILLTAEGTPKISDFGLARRLNGESMVTHTGVVAGTPSYMAPEQARRNLGTVGSAADIYALGVILYEMLTGQPPFHSETAAETIQRMTSQEPIPPSRLCAKVPRDLEIICLKCLQKKPVQRYPTALSLAGDLERFLRGEAIEARPVGRAERARRWIQRNPTLSALVVTALALLVLAINMGVRESAVSARREADLNKAATRLDQVVQLQKDGRIAESRELFGGLADSGFKELRPRIEQMQVDLALIARLDAIRLGRAARLGEQFVFLRSAEDYEKAFSDAGLVTLQEAPRVVAARIQASPVQTAIVAALDDWAASTRDPKVQRWVVEVAQNADRDPTGWRNNARDVVLRHANESLVQITEAAPIANQSVPLLLALADHMKSVSVDPIPFLQRIQQAHPSDFWVNLQLAEAMMERNELTEAIRFYQAAVALRPQVGAVYDNLGLALAMSGRMDEADEQFRKAASIDPAAVAAHENLGTAFSPTGRREDSLESAKPTREFVQQVAALHTTLGDTLRDKGKTAEAKERYRRAIAILPQHTPAHYGLRTILMREHRLDEAFAAWRKAIEALPPDVNAWDGYAELCLFFEETAEYGRIRSLLVERFGSETDLHICERTGRACLLAPLSGKELAAAEMFINRALAAEPNEPYFLFAKGLAEYRRGDADLAIATMDGAAAVVLGPCPRFVKALALFQQGKVAEARKTLVDAVLSHDWRREADNRDLWIIHVLRREAEAVILPTLREFLAGRHEPQGNDERLALIAGCRSRNCHDRAARLYAEAFASDPQLPKDFRAGHRYEAARAAALAVRDTGRDTGEDAKAIAADERTRLQTQARQWLEEDLKAWKAALTSDFAANGESTHKALVRWRTDPGLRSIRDHDDLDKMSPEEKSLCDNLWREISAMIDGIEKGD